MLSAIVLSALIIGHRGASGHLPENTLPAFAKAIEMGADGIELDVWPDVNGHPVVIHDEDLERTYRQKGKVTGMRVEDLSVLGVPRYEDVLELAKGKLIVFTELKGMHEDKVADAIHRAVSENGWSYDALPVIGFDHDQLERLKDANPAIVTGASFSRKMLEHIPRDKHAAFMVSKASSIHASAINPDYRLVTPEIVEKAHAAGLKVNVWTVNSPAAMDKLLALRVDAIMTDYPDRLHGKIHGE